MSTTSCWSVVLFLCLNFGINASMYCYWNTGCPYKYFSSKTPYNFIRGDIRDSLVRIKGCEPVSIWSISRHGKRLPSEVFSKPIQEILYVRNKIIASHEAGNSSLCAQDVENLKNWNNNFDKFDPSGLTPEGYNEVKDFARRLKKTFPSLLDNLEKNKYIVRPNLDPRSEDSAKAFIAGINNNQLTYTKPTKEFDDMAPYTSCKKYQKEVRQNPAVTYAEAEKFKSNLEYLATKDRIQRRIGINFRLSDENISALYDLCRYDSSGYDKTLSPWCALFTAEDLKVLEYIGDLRHYYRNGYGQETAKIFGRLPLKNLLKSFKEAKEGKGLKLSSYISHATTMDMIYTTLGLFKDDKPLKAEHRNPNRKWRSCKMSTFSANLIAVLNRCTLNKTNSYNVILYLNEEPFLSICKEGVCTWQEFEEKITFDDVNYDFCNLTSTGN